MSVTGYWIFTAKTPLGNQTETMFLDVDDKTLIGYVKQNETKYEILDGKINGNELAWKGSVKKPMPFKYKVSATYADAKIISKIKMGLFGSFEFKAIRS